VRSHRTTPGRSLAAALAILAVAAPTAVARPIDLRSPDARDAAMHQKAVTPGPAKQLPGPPAWPVHPAPITRSARPAHDGGNDALSTVALALAAAGVVGGGAAAGVRVRVRARRPQPAA
jgi:hypothetical protein